LKKSSSLEVDSVFEMLAEFGIPNEDGRPVLWFPIYFKELPLVSLIQELHKWDWQVSQEYRLLEFRFALVGPLVDVFLNHFPVVGVESAPFEFSVEVSAYLLKLHQQTQSQLPIPSRQAENQEFNDACVFELEEGEVIVQVVLDE